MIKAYFKKIQDKLEEISPILSAVDIDYEIDENLNFGSVKGRLTFIRLRRAYSAEVALATKAGRPRVYPWMNAKI